MSSRKIERQVIKQLKALRHQADDQWIEALDHEGLGEDMLANTYYKKAFNNYQKCLELLRQITDTSVDPEFFYFTYKFIGNAYFEQSKGLVDIITLSVDCYDQALAIANSMKKLPEDEFDIKQLKLTRNDIHDYIESLSSTENESGEYDSLVEETIPMEISKDTLYESPFDSGQNYQDDLSDLLTMNTALFDTGSESYVGGSYGSPLNFDEDELEDNEIDLEDVFATTKKKAEPKSGGLKRAETEYLTNHVQPTQCKKTKPEQEKSDAELIIQFGIDTSETDAAQSLLDFTNSMQGALSYRK